MVLATGGCAFGERMLGAATLTGDGYLMAAEAGAVEAGAISDPDAPGLDPTDDIDVDEPVLVGALTD